ncbi:U-box domain-containing protein 33-like [Silene latifolia]|uniref:U-box domain-containing protein 33-like n=1 Tax=Silene latifolia TaxID=37657 RepID=UPI003D76CC72
MGSDLLSTFLMEAFRTDSTARTTLPHYHANKNPNSHRVMFTPPSRIVEKVQFALDNDDLSNILDHSAGQWPFVRAKQLVHLALRCCHAFPDNRPDLASDVWMLLKPSNDPSRSLETPLRLINEDRIPSYFICPILQEIMQDPHFSADGFTYEGETIKVWFGGGHDTSPMTNLSLENRHLTPNRALHSAIDEWQQKH